MARDLMLNYISEAFVRGNIVTYVPQEIAMVGIYYEQWSMKVL
jgi:hypothetical protein